jgi:hypothetical protein
MDASYKTAKKMAKYNGASVYDLIFTIKSINVEIWQQFYAVTESHDQLSEPLRELRKTLEAYGMDGPHLAFTDNPRRDKEMLLRTFPTLAKRQAALDKLSEKINKTAATDNTTATGGGDATVNDAAAVAAAAVVVINDNKADDREILQFSSLVEPGGAATQKFIALKDVISSRDEAKRIVAMDIEWKIDYSGGAGNSPIHLIQLGYERSDDVNPGADGGSVACLMLQLRNKPTMLPGALVNILKDEPITFTGRSIQGDITRLKKQELRECCRSI